MSALLDWRSAAEATASVGAPARARASWRAARRRQRAGTRGAVAAEAVRGTSEASRRVAFAHVSSASIAGALPPKPQWGATRAARGARRLPVLSSSRRMRVELVGSPPAAVLLRLSLLERLGALLFRDVSVPLSQLRAASVSQRPWRDRPWRGLRVGTGLPFVVLLGRMLRWRGGADLACVVGQGPALVLDLEPGARWRRVVASAPDAEALAVALQAALAERAE